MFKEISRKFWVNIALLSIGIGLLGFFVGQFHHSLGEVFSEKIAVTLITTACISLLWMLHEHMETAEKLRETAEKLRRSEVVLFETIKNDFPQFIIQDRNFNIGICGISLHTPLKCFIKGQNYFQLLRSKNLNNIEIQLLFCSPTSEYLRQRAKIECQQSSNPAVVNAWHKKYVFEAWCSIAYACQVYFQYKYISGHTGNLTIKMINDYNLPITHFVTDKIAVAGYFSIARGEKSPRIKAYCGSDEYAYAKGEFDYLFKRQDGFDIVGPYHPKLDVNKLTALLNPVDPDEKLRELKIAINNYIDNLVVVVGRDPTIKERELAIEIEKCIEAYPS